MAEIIKYSIYCFYTLDNKIYIGMTKNPQVRIQQHHYKSCNFRLRALLADPSTVIYSDILYTDLSQEKAIELEKKLITRYRVDPDYEILNIQSGGLRGNNKVISKPKISKSTKSFKSLSNTQVLEMRIKCSKIKYRLVDPKIEAVKYGLGYKYFVKILKGQARNRVAGPLLGKDYKWLK